MYVYLIIAKLAK